MQSHGRPSIALNSRRKLPQHSSTKCYQYILLCRIPNPSETQLVTKWKRSDLAADDRVFTSRYVYKLKRDAISGKVSRFKARLIVQGFKIQQGVDYNDTFSPTPGSTATRTIISIATAEIWNITALTLHRHSFRQIACQRASIADSSSRPLQALHTPTPLVLYTRFSDPSMVSPPARAPFTKHFIVTSKVRGLRTPGSKNLYGAARQC